MEKMRGLEGFIILLHGSETEENLINYLKKNIEGPHRLSETPLSS